MDRRLVWVPSQLAHLADRAPSGVRIAATPDDPPGSSDLAAVEMLVLGRQGGGLLELLERMERLQVVQTTSAGIDLVAPWVPDGVTLCSARGAYGDPVSEWCVAAILAAYKDLPHLRDEQVAGRWSSLQVRQVMGSTVLLLGYGSIAEGLERRLAGFGVSFLRIARTARSGVATLDSLAEFLPLADIVVVLVPLTGETTGLVDARFLAQMRSGALLVNAARGEVVDTDALIDALSAGHVSAVLDVTDPEPLPDHHRMFSTPNLFITPHVAGGRAAGGPVLEALISSQIARFADGEPLVNVSTHGY